MMVQQVRDCQEMGFGRDHDDGKDVTITDVNDVVISVEPCVIQDMKCPLHPYQASRRSQIQFGNCVISL